MPPDVKLPDAVKIFTPEELIAQQEAQVEEVTEEKENQNS